MDGVLRQGSENSPQRDDEGAVLYKEEGLELATP